MTRTREKPDERRIHTLLGEIEKKLQNIEAGQRFLAMVELHEAEKRYRRAKAIVENLQRQRAPRRKARRP